MAKHLCFRAEGTFFAYDLVVLDRIFFVMGEKMQVKAQIMNAETMARVIVRISHEIAEKNNGVDGVVIFGVKKRGVPLAKAICDSIASFENASIPMGELDITNRRDDLTEEQKKAKATQSVIPCDINGKTVIIADDVLYTGRTVKAAIETIFQYGRPKSVQFVALIDRGHRELPIRPDYIGKNVPTSKTESVSVRFTDTDGETGVYIVE